MVVDRTLIAVAVVLGHGLDQPALLVLVRTVTVPMREASTMEHVNAIVLIRARTVVHEASRVHAVAKMVGVVHCVKPVSVIQAFV